MAETETHEVGLRLILREDVVASDSFMRVIARQARESRDMAFHDQGLILVQDSERIQDEIFPETHWCYARDNETKVKTDCPLNGKAHRHRTIIWDGMPA